MSIHQEVSMLLRWLGSESHFNAKPELLKFHKLLQESDSDALEAIVAENGGIRALEIILYGAPLSYLLGRGYAPGQYMGTCMGCQEITVRDKRALVCLPCAVKNYAPVSDS